MTDKVQKIREEVERLKKWNDNVRNSTRHMTLQEEDFNRGKHSSYLEILNFIDSLQEEPVSGEWIEELRTKLDSMSKEDFKKVFDKYAINSNEVPVSEIDFEQELYKAFGQVKDFTLGMQIAKRFYEMGRNHQKPEAT